MTETLSEPAWITGSDGIRRPARREDTTERDNLIIRLRNQGLTHRAIAEQAGCSQMTARRVVQRAREAAEAAIAS